MSIKPQLPLVAKLLSLGLIVAALGVTIQFFTGVPGFPKVPPGPFILGGAGILVALLRWRWTPIVGLIVALFISVGLLAAGGAGDRLSTPGELGPFIGTAFMVLGLITAIGSGAAATLRLLRPPRGSGVLAGLRERASQRTGA